MKKITLAVFVVLLTACSAKEQKVNARIMERKQAANGKLMLSYTFEHRGKIYTGIATINNQVIPNDSVEVRFQPNNPNNSKPCVR
jgi:hypothetical protein